MKYLKINIFTYLQFILIFFFLLIHNSNNCFAQTIQGGNPYIQNYDNKNFNTSGKQIWAILQDKRSVMYFGNIDGLLEFDGSNWRLIEMPNKSTVRSMAIDSTTGRIYIGAKSDIGYIEADTTGTMQYISLLKKIPEEHRNFDDVWETFVIDNQVIFRTNFYAFILKNNKIKILKSENRFHVSFCVNNRFYVREWETGLLTLINDSLKIIPYGEQFAKERIYVMFPYEDDKILIVTRTQGIFIYTKPLGFHKPKGFEDVDNFLIKNQIYSGAKLDSSHFVLGSLQDGLIIIDKSGNIIRHINKKSGLQDNTIISIGIDSQKNIWAGLNNGVSYIIVNSPFSIFSEKTGLQGSVYTAIYYQNQLYAGTSIGIFCKDRQHDFFMLNNTKGQSWYLSEIMGKLYCAHHEGILRINKNSAENISTYGNTWNFLELVSHPNYVLAGTSDNGLILLEYKNNKLIVKNKIKGFDESSRWVQEDNEGNIWVSHENKGIFRLKLNQNLDSVTELNFYNTNHGLPANTYNYVFKIKTTNQNLAKQSHEWAAHKDVELNNSRIVFGTEKGIYQYNSKTNRFVLDETFNKLLKKDGLIDIFTQDKKGNIWYKEGNEKGLLLLQNNGTYKSRKTPFLKIKSLVISIYVIDTANILFNTYDNIIHYNSLITPYYDSPYPTLIRQVYANDSLIFGGTDNKENNLSGFAKLPYKQNNLFFTYSAPFYEDHNKTQYNYYLEGFEKKWSEWSLKTEKEYTNLPEGNYSFKVKAKNIFEKESTIAVYSFIILPPWYRTIFAYIIYGLIFILIFYIGIIVYTKRLKAANVRLEKIVKERTTEIVKQKEEIQAQANELEKLSIVASETDNGVMIMDAEGKIEWVNEGYTKMLGYTLNDLLKEKRDNLLKVSSYKNIRDVLQSIHNSKKPKIYESENTTKSGKKKWVQTTITPFLDNNKEIRKLISIDSNITKLKNAEEEISSQKEEIIDSIIYAKRIQNALFPSKEIMLNIIPEYFILDLPQGIVSGDFYWFSKINNKIVIAVADCTGHGVPGAFMSMLGVTMLNKIVNEKGIIKPNEILDRLRNNVITSLHQTGEIGEANDGMDIALITIDKKNNSLEYAGANNSAYLFRNNELIEIFANKMPIGIYQEIETPFSCQKMSLQTNDIIYLFTDGYADQFGGLKGRKFLYKNFKMVLKEIHHLPMNEQKTRLFKTHREWKDNNEQIDDILVMGIKI